MAKIMKSYTNAFNKASKTSYFRTFEEGQYVAKNPFSGAEFVLNALELSIYDFCIEWYKRYEQGDYTEVPVQTYDNMRYYFMALKPAAYMALLD